MGVQSLNQLVLVTDIVQSCFCCCCVLGCWHPFSNLKVNEMIVMIIIIINCVVDFVCFTRRSFCVVCECLFLFESVCVCVCYTPANKSVVVCPFSIVSKNGRQRNRRRYIGLYLPLFVCALGYLHRIGAFQWKLKG